MMNHPPVNELVQKAGCRYMLVTAVSKRARRLMESKEDLGVEKPVSIAVEELYDGELKLEYPEEYHKTAER